MSRFIERPPLSFPLSIPFFFFSLRPDCSFSPDGTIIDKDFSSRVNKVSVVFGFLISFFFSRRELLINQKKVFY